ncbi:tripartite tricarboxylate transporter substrate binding protein [Xenophilus arseniciresistens]|uniref:Tripartite tricarboxylate transporter substrate binding protein n=1 Tax=Xenophilus arseniciresistens TaxID=1283306 RepID=A0AAE3SXT3_9BURK|nr:tripartite tricarboxylate transporter substrate binding protein [Xenophilus arseniciresistens]MDA7415264.1 tripartite tricarboxylate transporter substrate binding protein [Xenophilus arseniciresistens]
MTATRWATPPSRRLALQILGLAGLAPAFHAWGQSYPSRTVNLIVPQTAGGAADRLARILAERLEARWKRSVIVENKPGGGVVIGSTALARAPRDGHTFGLLGSSLSINAVQRSDLPYDAVKDFTPLARLGYYTTVLVADRSLPANSIQELVALAKKEPGKLSFGSNGIGTAAQLAGELLKRTAGIDMLHVPYNGAAKLYTDMVGGLVPMGFAVASSAEPFVKSGQLKVLGVTSARRSPLYPDWPAIAETYPGYEAVNWAGFCGPAGIAPAVAEKISADIVALLMDEQVARLMADMGFEVAALPPEAFGRFIRDEIQRFAQVTRPLPVK